ncbi:MAG: hypothetical protein IPH48_17870 [bacterium]|nr:hypothetical protein [bacterium]
MAVTAARRGRLIQSIDGGVTMPIRRPVNCGWQIAIASLFVLVSCCRSASADTHVHSLYAVGPAYGPQTDWQNADTVFGAPTGDCNDGANPQYAWNEVADSEEWLEVRHWDAFELEPGYVISRVEVDVNGRYDDMSSANRFVLRSSGPFAARFDSTSEWAQSGFDCEWHMGGNGRDITNAKPAAWTADDIANLRLAVRRVNNSDPVEPKRARVNAFRVIVTTTNEARLAVSPNPLLFGNVDPQNFLDKIFTVRNTGATVVDIDIASSCASSAFATIYGAGFSQLDPGDQVDITVRFSPSNTDPAFCNLELGNDLVPIEVLTGNPCDAVTIPAGTIVAAADTQYDFKDVRINGGTVTVIGSHTFCGLSLAAGSVLTQIAEDQQGIDLEVLTGCTIEMGARIDVAGMGAAAGAGPGVGASVDYHGAGGGYGGEGGIGSNAPGGQTYGSYEMPTDLGSGGGSGSNYGTSLGGPGGGLVRLNVHGALTVDGQISANGGPGTGGYYNSGGGGSGGSIYLTVGALAGGGAIAAIGGAGVAGGTAGGGGGGRIAVHCDADSYTGTYLATGGSVGVGGQRGGAGTVFIKRSNETLGELDIANVGLPAGARTGIGGQSNWAANVTIRSGGVLGRVNGLIILGDMHVAADGAISADMDGYGPGAGPGAGSSVEYRGAGGGYGGEGGVGFNTSGGQTYGSYDTPLDLGSGGGSGSNYGTALGGPGGGLVRLDVHGSLTVDGQISANGGSGTGDNYYQSGGGGSGGSIYLTVGTLAGGGEITANGGASGGGGAAGGGGGGRIAVHCDADSYTGTYLATGGSVGVGGQRGGAGTVFIKRSNETLGELDIANVGLPAGARTGVGGQSSWAANVTIGSGGVLGRVNGLIILGDMHVAADGAISADMDGYGPGAGPGAGPSVEYRGAGGGYGGEGGVGFNTSGGQTYGSYDTPLDLGSGGGSGTNYGTVAGGSGGGLVRLVVHGTLTVDGQITANGGPGTGDSYYQSGGGGSGGSINLTVGALAGGGTISASGGACGGGGAAGGGGGGRIAVHCDADSYTGTYLATGGSVGTGGQRGGAGTVFIKRSSETLGELDIANAGLPAGARTGVGGQSSWAANVTIGSGGVLGRVTGLTVLGDLHVATDGTISADMDGYGPGTGPGAGASVDYWGAGGGYGGEGGIGNSTIGGQTYGSYETPSDLGSGGGSGTNYGAVAGGSGGGLVRLVVQGTLTVDGQITANGGPGTGGHYESGGGGSGGSIYLTVGTLAGGGEISANGGASGGEGAAGGGGGGRIAICSASGFADFDIGNNVKVTGGAGSGAGADGTKYFCVAPLSGVNEFESDLPLLTALRGNSPNPFNPLTTIEFDLSALGSTRLDVYDLHGRLVRTLLNEQLEAGHHEVRWDGIDAQGRRMASGVYLYKMEAGPYCETRRMTLLK